MTKRGSSNIKKRFNIVVAATYTQDLIFDTLKYFMNELDILCDIQFASYNQVLQELLNPTSLFSLNTNGVNVILLKYEDWYRYASKTIGYDMKKELVEKNSNELINAIKAKAEKSYIPYFICLCPSNPKEENELKEVFEETDKMFEKELNTIKNLNIIKYEDIKKIYPLDTYYDEHTNRIAHIPYTKQFFTAMATLLARKIYSYVSEPFKVIVVDCDNTLWRGVCGENKLSQIMISNGFNKFQSILEKKRREGMLIAICSKNAEEDVINVFENHTGMILKKESIVSWYCNWEEKSKNIKELSKELGLSMDSIIFIDDNPLECAEVEANCPNILTIQFPKNENEIETFIENIWPFDKRKITNEDRERTKFYQDNVKREQFQNDTSSYLEFIKGLQLQINIEEVSKENIARISQLTQRTNQFNFTTIRRKESEIVVLCNQENYKCLVVSAKDRFGDYGMVGVLIFKIEYEEVIIDTFCLSCRALGRNIEHKMIEYVSQYSLSKGIKKMVIPCIKNSKNMPAVNFLNSICKKKEQENEYYKYLLTTSDGILISDKCFLQKEDGNKEDESNNFVNKAKTKTKSDGVNKRNKFLEYISNELNSVEKIVDLMNSQKHNKALISNSDVLPSTSIQKKLVELWSEYFNLNNIGIRDDFFELGGTSILVIQVLSKVRQVFTVEIPLSTVFDGNFTIEKLAKEIVYEKLKNFDMDFIKDKFKSVDSLPYEDKGDLKEGVNI